MMKSIGIFLGCAFALVVVGCSMSSNEDQMENAIRNELSKQGTVNQVEMTQEGDNMVGFAELRSNDGSEGRLRCTATRDATKSGSYNWRCLPTIDQRVIDSMTNQIRQSLAQNGEVTQIQLTRQDDMRMTGRATVRDPSGNEIHANCTVTRENEGSNHFNWECQPADSSSQPSSEEPAEPADAGEGGK